jgi:hypothetical protein
MEISVSSATMELILNLVWLFIAIALVCVWRTQWAHQRLRPAHGRRVQEWSAVGLALVLLFFAVSMSDDMHSEIVALEELSGNSRDHLHLGGTQPVPHPPSLLHAVWSLMATDLPSFSDSIAVDAMPFEKLLVDSRPSGSPKSNRAPPVRPL